MNTNCRALPKSITKTCLTRSRNQSHARSNRHPYNYVLCTRRPFYQATRVKPMHVRRAAVAILFGAVSYRAWQSYYRQTGLLGSGSMVGDHETRASFGKKTLVVGAGSLHTITQPENEKSAKESNESGRKYFDIMTPEQATSKLRRNEESYLVGRENGVERYDIVQIPSNDPIEDDHAEEIIEIPFPKANSPSAVDSISDWMFWGVYDGHSGWTTSAKLREALINYVAREINSIYQTAPTDKSMGYPSNEAIHTAIKTGFKRLDDKLVYENVEEAFKTSSKAAADELLAPALSGSCALLALYNNSSKTLHVACTGDSRAVLGRRGENGKLTAIPLSEDQTGSNPNEEARLRREHPGEENVIKHGRVLGGLEPTRSFSDAHYKWNRKLFERLNTFSISRSPHKLLKTPPYVTAEPVVTTTQINPEKNDFLVLATDGLWEMLSNEEVIGLVGKWIQKERSKKKDSKSWENNSSDDQDNSLPIEHDGQKIVNHGQNGQKTPMRHRQWGLEAEEERFVVQDRNVATHLVRNALGGKNTETVCALLSLPAPYSRRYRDDLTVQVIFFGTGGDRSGKVIVNKEACQIKAKL